MPVARARLVVALIFPGTLAFPSRAPALRFFTAPVLEAPVFAALVFAALVFAALVFAALVFEALDLEAIFVESLFVASLLSRSTFFAVFRRGLFEPATFFRAATAGDFRIDLPSAAAFMLASRGMQKCSKSEEHAAAASMLVL